MKEQQKLEKVSFQGNQYWLITEFGRPFVLAPLSHFNADGNIIPEVALGPNGLGFATVRENGEVVHRGQVIGNEAEIEKVAEA